MISGKQLHGLSVKDQNDRKLGVVQDLIANRQSGVIEGFIINIPGFISTTAFLPANKVKKMDLSGMTVENKNCLCRLPKTKFNNTSTLHMGEITTQKGVVTDILLEANKISAVEISQGLLNDIRDGRQTIQWEEM